MKRLVLFIVGFGCLSILWATVPFREGAYPGMPAYLNLATDTTDPLRLRFNYLYEFREIADFLTRWQLDDADSADDGGMIEAESGSLRSVIQTDNTQEAIWVWSRYGELTGDTARYRKNIGKAWKYCNRYPAWKEEAQTGLYYPSHNCAWGIAAEDRYRRVYGNEDWIWYRDSCARFMEITTPRLNKWTLLDRLVMGWCAGWLYRYGAENNDQEAMDTACAVTDSIISWMRWRTPEVVLKEETWAMSAGTMVWGFCNSSFKRDTVRGKQWIEENGSFLDTFQVWQNIDYYSWDNSWNVGYANGHGAMYDISHDTTYRRHHLWLTNKLLSYDTDNDGGIMATTKSDNTVDMCWVTSYLAMMGLDRLIGEVHDKDAGVLEIRGIRDGDTIKKGTKIDLEAVVTNYGREPLNAVEVTLSGAASGSWTADLGFMESDTIVMKTNWVVPDTAVLVLSISHPEDENPSNNTLRVGINCLAPEGTAETVHPPSPMPVLEVNAVSRKVLSIDYAIPEGVPGKVSIYDAGGALVNRNNASPPGGKLTIDVSQLPGGVYFIRLESGCTGVNRKFIVLR